MTPNPSQAPATGSILFPALAGFQSEHAVEIPFMLTTERERKSSHGNQNGRSLEVFWTILAIGNCLGKVSHEFPSGHRMKFRSYGELDCGGSCKVRQHFELRNRQGRPLPAGQSSLSGRSTHEYYRLREIHQSDNFDITKS